MSRQGEQDRKRIPSRGGGMIAFSRFIYSFERQSGRERVRDEFADLSHDGQAWTHMGDRGLSPWAVFRCFHGKLDWELDWELDSELDWEWSSWNGAGAHVGQQCLIVCFTRWPEP